MLTTVGSALSGVIAVAITLMGARYLLDPRPAAAGFGIPGEIGDPQEGSRGPTAVAFGVHWATATLMLIVAALLIV